MSEQWGPWIEHDGMGCPLKSPSWCQVEFADGELVTHYITRMSWMWFWPCCDARGRSDCKIIRYRIRKPRALSQLQQMIRELEGEPV